MSILKSYSQWGGIDYRSNDLTKNRITARDNENTDISERGSLTKRFGSTSLEDVATTNLGVWGMGTWTNKQGVRLPVYMGNRDLFVGDADDATNFTAADQTAYIASILTPSGVDDSIKARGATFASVNGNLYIATGHTPLLKYDGRFLQVAGAPTKAIDSIDEDTSTNEWTATTVSYKFSYVIADSNGVVTTGQACTPVPITFTKTALNYASVFVPSISEATDGIAFKYDDSSSTVPPLTIANTFNVQLDETKWGVGDFVFQENFGPDAREVQAFKLLEKIGTNSFKTDTLFTAAYAGAVCNIYIQLLRSIDGNPYEIVYEKVNTSSSTVGFADIAEVSGQPYSLGIYDELENVGYQPVNPKYVSTHRNQLIVSGIQDEPNSVYFSDITDQEAFSPNNSFIPGFNRISEIRGTASFQGGLLAFTLSNIFVISGILDNSTGYSVDPYPGGNIGALNQNGIIETDFGLVITTASGPWVINSLGQYPQWFGERVANYFIDRGGAIIDTLPSAVWLPTFRKLMITGSGLDIMMYDTKSDTWHRWTELHNNVTLMAATNSTAYTVYQSEDETTDTVKKLKTSYTESNFNDDGNAISCMYKTVFDPMGEWSRFKKYLRLKVFRSSDSGDTRYTQSAGAFNLNIDFYYDLDTDNVWSTSLSLTNQTTFPYWAKSKLPNKKAHSISITFSNAENNKKLSIAGYELEYELPYIEKVQK